MKIPTSWPGLRVGVLGLGRSGRAATRLLAQAGAHVYASDSADTPELRAAAELLRSDHVEIEFGAHDAERLAVCDLLVASPGIPPYAEVFQSSGVRGRPTISELELAFHFLQAPLIAVTGTNGKTTTTAWIGATLKRAGLRVGVGGNIGRALSELASEDPAAYEWVVAEVSSFQLAQIVDFRPTIGVLLNLCPDHLDRYVDVNRYYADKARLFENATSDSRWVLNGEDEAVLEMAESCPGHVRYFHVSSPLPDGDEGAYLHAGGGTLMARHDGREVELVHRDELQLLGMHNVANALATAAVATFADIPETSIREGLRGFEPLAHRLQPVAEKDGVFWVNDSKATNVASTRVALRAMRQPVVLLLGGRAKGQSFLPLVEDLPNRVKAIVAYGEAAEQIEGELSGFTEVIREQGTFTDVCRRAAASAAPGDVVLLAPGCASFDMFKDYEERGERFVRFVREGRG